MQNFDFLSSSPKFFIFKKETNKTSFGGILFLIYIIIMIFISLAYILDYAINDKYSIESFSTYNYTLNGSETELINKDIKLNPYLEMNISFEPYFDDKVAVYKTIRGNKTFLEKKYTIITGSLFAYYELKEKVNDTEFSIAYICGTDANCSLFYYFIDSFADIYLGYFNFYNPGKINHSEDPPIQKDEDVSNYFMYQLYIPEEIGLREWDFDWEVIKYKDKMSLIDSLTQNKREYYSGHVKDGTKSNEFIYRYSDNYSYHIDYDESIGYYIDFFRVKFFNFHRDYLLYKRTKREIMDVVANIGALFSTIKFVFSVVFYFYSKNYDNYEVVGNILNPNKVKKEIHILGSKNKKEEKNDIMNDINNLDKLIEEDSSRINNELNKQEYNVNNDLEYDEEGIQKYSCNTLKKLHFYDYFFNNIYSKCCGKNKNQELINNANKIIYKYLSIDSLLYNQIKLESLFKDYKWNNPVLNNIQNNKMIIKLKNT